MKDPGPFGLRFAGEEAARAAASTPPSSELWEDADAGSGAGPERDRLIEADNLDALKLLRGELGGRVQLVYIDPPYNTGNAFVYRDAFGPGPRGRDRAPDPRQRRHAGWLAMMLPRLLLARELLRPDGVLFVSIGDHEVHHLRVMLDEVFGESAFVGQITVVSNRGGRDYRKIASTHEYLLCYGRGPESRIRELPKDDPGLRHDDARGPYQLRELRNRNPRFSPANRPNLFYPVWVDPEPRGVGRACSLRLAPDAEHTVRVEPRNRVGEPSVWRWSTDRLRRALVGTEVDACEAVARRRPDGGFNVYEKFRKTTAKVRSVWDDPCLRSERGTADLRARLGAMVFEHAKPVELIRRCIRLGCDRDGLVLDFFAGSGTTAEAVLLENRADGGDRRYVLVQRPEPTPEGSLARQHGFATISEIALARIHRVLETLGPGSGPGLRVLRARPIGAEARDLQPTPGGLATPLRP